MFAAGAQGLCEGELCCRLSGVSHCSDDVGIKVLDTRYILSPAATILAPEIGGLGGCVRPLRSSEQVVEALVEGSQRAYTCAQSARAIAARPDTVPARLVLRSTLLLL